MPAAATWKVALPFRAVIGHVVADPRAVAANLPPPAQVSQVIEAYRALAITERKASARILECSRESGPDFWHPAEMLFREAHHFRAISRSNFTLYQE